MQPSGRAQDSTPSAGDIVSVRSRLYLVEDLKPPIKGGDATLLALSCLDDDAQGERLDVLWEREVDAEPLGQGSWRQVAERGFDEPAQFSAYLHALRWGCVTATDPELFQAPWRAGIEVKAFQLDPLRKALRLPRVNLFIADDVGLGKTIEAGLILRELLIRQRVRRVVIAAPPSVVRQWQDEMERRFGLGFAVFDRAFVAQCRREHGWTTNPWSTHSRFIVSHALLRNEAYAGPLRDWLEHKMPAAGTLLILDEAHHAAPSSGSLYAVDSQFTKAVRELAPIFEHRLFLSATPHNGHSNSFAALLEILDPLRFCRGVRVDPRLLRPVMVRRLKSDLRGIQEEFPRREIVPMVIDGLGPEAPELVLADLLDDFRAARAQRLAPLERWRRAQGLLVVSALQKRLLSSIEAFARTLRKHRTTLLEKTTVEPREPQPSTEELDLFRQGLLHPPDGDDERAGLDSDEVAAEEDRLLAEATRQSSGARQGLAPELESLDRMIEIAEAARHRPDARVEKLIDWIREHQCPDLDRPGASWLERRVLVFTEYADTLFWLQRQIESAIARSDRATERVAIYHGSGSLGERRRRQIQDAFNEDPADHPLRILLATDAAREGINLQNHCADLFHFDVPWNPSRLEQRNGRIDRKLQRSEVVRCHYFVYAERVEDVVLEQLFAKTEVILRELGSLSPVLAAKTQRLLDGGLGRDRLDELRRQLEALGSEEAKTQRDELDEVTERRQHALAADVEELRDLLERSKRFLQLDVDALRSALSVSLELLDAPPLEPVEASEAFADTARARWRFPDLASRKGADPTWTVTLDTLRRPRRDDEDVWQWRREAPIRPVVFQDPQNLSGKVVHLHLEHRVVQRLLGRFIAQGFVHHELTRAAAVLTDETHPRVVLFGRLSLFGPGASRLHDEILAVGARWLDEGRRVGTPLNATPIAGESLFKIESSLSQAAPVPPAVAKTLTGHAELDARALQQALGAHAASRCGEASDQLRRRAETEARQLRGLLERQRSRIERKQGEVAANERQMTLGFDEKESRQLRADRNHWAKRLAELDEERDSEPARLRESYRVEAQHMRPIALVYLWPRTG